MITKKQIAEENRKEREFNKLSQSVIGKTAWGKFYGLMRGASKLLTDNLEQRVGIDESGRPIVVYKKDIGKFIGTFAVPAHEWMAKEYAKKDWGGLFTSVLTGGFSTMMKNIKQQNKAKFFDISPKEVEEIENKRKQQYAKRIADKKREYLDLLAKINKNKKEKNINSNKIIKNTILPMPKPVAIGLGVLVLAVGGYFVYKKFIKK